jgi:hypothetical protein
MTGPLHGTTGRLQVKRVGHFTKNASVLEEAQGTDSVEPVCTLHPVM